MGFETSNHQISGLHLDHLVLTVADITRAQQFYQKVFGMRIEVDSSNRASVHLPGFKINFHQVGRERLPHAQKPTVGSADLCFVSDDNLEVRLAHLRRCGVTVIEGPVSRPGASGLIESVYFRDPDGNLIEWGSYKA